MKFRVLMITTAMLATSICAVPSFAQSVDRQKEKIQAESAQLAPEKAKMYNEAMQAAAEANKELRQKIHKAHEEADAILTAEKFDKAAFLAKAKELDALYDQTRAKMNDAFVAVAEKLAQDDRKILLKARNDNRRK